MSTGPARHPQALIRKITVHLICNHLRTQKTQRRAGTAVELDERLPSSVRDPEQQLGAVELVHTALRQMDLTNKYQADLIRLIDLGGATPEDVAGGMGLPPARLHVQLCRARGAFRKAVEALSGTELGASR